MLLTLLTLALVFLLPKWESFHPSVSRARRFMAAGTGLLAVQFLLQYLLGLRNLGVTQAVMLNLLFFMPRYQLTTWLKISQQEPFSSWLTRLRIEEAK